MNTDEHIRVLFAVDGPSGPDTESVWAKPHPRGFEILNIPFYALGIALGDIVATEVGEGRAYWFRSLVHASGHSTIQIVMHNDSEKSRVVEYLVRYGCLIEQSDLPCLLSVDLAPSLSYTDLKKFLDECSALEILGYQEACLAHDR